jgi:hypothetical protein
MYSWATPEKLLYGMTLDQIIKLYNEGWEAQKKSAWLFWGILGEIMQGRTPEDAARESKEKIKGLNKFKEAHPEAQTKGGAWEISK